MTEISNIALKSLHEKFENNKQFLHDAGNFFQTLPRRRSKMDEMIKIFWSTTKTKHCASWLKTQQTQKDSDVYKAKRVHFIHIHNSLAECALLCNPHSEWLLLIACMQPRHSMENIDLKEN